MRLNPILVANPKIAFLARVLGLTTYPLYLSHQVIGAALIGYLFRSGLNQYVALIFSIAVVVSMSAVIALVFEPIAQGWLRSKIDHINASLQAAVRPEDDLLALLPNPPPKLAPQRTVATSAFPRADVHHGDKA